MALFTKVGTVATSKSDYTKSSQNIKKIMARITEKLKYHQIKI
jgi:hypothetical protein